MKNAHIINLIRFYAENNDAEFRKEAYKIASESTVAYRDSCHKWHIDDLSHKLDDN